MWKKLKRAARISLLIFAVCGGIYGALAYRYWSNPPQLSHNYAAELNAPVLKFPEDERAWPIYREAIIELDTDAPEQWNGAWNFRHLVEKSAAAEHLRHHEPALAKVRAAAKLPSLGFVLSNATSREDRRLQNRRYSESLRKERESLPLETPDENPHILTVLLHPTGESSGLVMALQADAMLAAREGDAERMTEDLLTLMRFADHLRELPLLVNDLRSATVFSTALYSWGLLLEQHRDLFTSERLRRLEDAARSFAGGNLQPRFDGERKMFYDVVQRMYSDDGEGDGFFYATAAGDALLEGPLDPVATALAPLATWRFSSRRETLANYDRLIDLIEVEGKQPLWKADFIESDALLTQLNIERKQPLINLFAPTPRRAYDALEEVVQQRDAMLAVSAAHRYRLDNGAWPPTLEALVPAYLHEAPLDRIVGKPLRYRLVDDRPLLYSVAWDKRDDDGRPGTVPRDDLNNPGGTVQRPWHWWFIAYRNDPPSGDVIFWPVEGRDPPAI